MAKTPTSIPQKTKFWSKYKRFKISYLEFFFGNFISDIQIFNILPYVPVDINSFHSFQVFIPCFLVESLKANKKYYLFHTSLILQTSTHLTLKIIAPKTQPKTFLTLPPLYKFSSNHVSVCCQKNICTAPFPDTQELHS